MRRSQNLNLATTQAILLLKSESELRNWLRADLNNYGRLARYLPNNRVSASHIIN